MTGSGSGFRAPPNTAMISNAQYGQGTDNVRSVRELKYEPVSFDGEGTVEIRMPSLNLTDGTYFLDVAVHRRDGQPYDYHRSKLTFRVHSKIKDVGIFRPPHSWEFSPEICMKASVPVPSHQ